jgi:ATP-dependent Clp protease adaptor protein ClpS
MSDWDDDDDIEGGDHDTGILTETKKKVEKPPRFKVLLHNDDYTTMEFVVFILKSVFNKTDEDAVKIMLAVHQAGIGVAGVYGYEVAEAKANRVVALAQANEYPLLCTLEEE